MTPDTLLYPDRKPATRNEIMQLVLIPAATLVSGLILNPPMNGEVLWLVKVVSPTLLVSVVIYLTWDTYHLTPWGIIQKYLGVPK